MSDHPEQQVPEVEPLSDVAWARVERGLWARMDNATSPLPVVRPSRRWLWIAAPTVAAAAVAVAVVALRSSGSEPVEVAHGPDGSDTSDVRVVAPASAPTTASFNDAFIELEPSAAVVMRHDRPTTLLERGAATFKVAPRGGRPPFVVLAGDATVRVIGTQFRVARSPAVDERITVEVEHGIVEVQFHGEQVRIGAHQSWTSDHPRDLAPVQTATRPARITDEPARARDDIELPPTKVRREPPSKLEPSKPEPSKQAPNKPGQPEIDADRAKFERAAALETKDPKAAIAGYLELSQSSAKWASNALFAAGRLAADRGDPRARSLLTVYLKRFPTGANVEDARSLLARLP